MYQASAATGAARYRSVDTTPTAPQPHMAAPGPAGVRNVRHAFTLSCEEGSWDALLSLEGQDDAVCLPHGKHWAFVYVLLHVTRVGSSIFSDVNYLNMYSPPFFPSN